MDLSSHTGATETSPLAWILLHSQKFLSVQAMMIALLLKLKTQAIQFHLSLKVEVSNLFQLITIYVDTVNFVVQNLPPYGVKFAQSFNLADRQYFL